MFLYEVDDFDKIFVTLLSAVAAYLLHSVSFSSLCFHLKRLR